MWHDEVQAFRAAEQLHSPGDVYQIEGFSARIAHPPLFFVLLKFWMTLTGQTDFALRALTAFCGLLAAAFIYRVTVDMSHRPAGGFAAAVIFGGMGLASYMIHQTHTYSLLMTGAAMMLFFYYRWRRCPRRRYAAGIVLSTLILAYTHYFSVYLILAFNLHALFLERNQIRRWIALQLIAVAGYMPWLPMLIWLIAGGYGRTEAATIVATSTATSWPAVVTTAQQLLFDGWEYYAAFLALGVAAAAASPEQSRRQAARAGGLLLAVGGGSLLLALLGNTVWQALIARRVIFVLVFIAVLLGYGFAHMPARLRWVALAAFLVATPDTSRPDDLPGNWYFRQTIEHVAGHAGYGDAVYINMPGALESIPFRHYAERLLPDGVPFHTPDDPLQDTINTLLPRERVWVVWDQSDDKPVRWRHDALNRKSLVEIQRHEIAHFRVSLYAVPDHRPIPSLAYGNPARLALPQVFEDRFELIHVEVDRLNAAPGEVITVNLDWRALRRAEEDWGIFVHLIEDDRVTLHGQADSNPTHLGETLSTLYWPVGAAIYDQHALKVDPNTPPGTYNLRVGIYSRVQARRLAATPSDGTGGDDGVIIARIRVP